MKTTIWFTKPGTTGDCVLISNVDEPFADKLAANLNEEFPDCNFWVE